MPPYDSSYHEERSYRRWLESDLIGFQVTVGESDLHISAERTLADEAEEALERVREELEEYVDRDPKFRTALAPRALLPDRASHRRGDGRGRPCLWRRTDGGRRRRGGGARGEGAAEGAARK